MATLPFFASRHPAEARHRCGVPPLRHPVNAAAAGVGPFCLAKPFKMVTAWPWARSNSPGFPPMGPGTVFPFGAGEAPAWVFEGPGLPGIGRGVLQAPAGAAAGAWAPSSWVPYLAVARPLRGGFLWRGPG